jgi:3-oxoacyl-[acyl-carrier-protein] synthase III
MEVAAVRHALPSQRVSNDDLVAAVTDRNDHLAPHDLDALLHGIRRGWDTSGTSIRYVRSDGERAIDFALTASRDAMRAAGCAAHDIDFVIYVGVGRGWLEPATANVLMHELGLTRATGFDLLDACASWLRALQVAHAFLQTGTYRTGLIVNAEFNAREFADLRFDDPATLRHRFAQLTIGEAATATVVSKGADDDFHFVFRNASAYYAACMIPLPNATDFGRLPCDMVLEPLRFHALSEELVARAAHTIVDAFRSDDVLPRGSYDIVFGHSAGERIEALLCRQLDVAESSYYPIHARVGNTVSASVPLAMSLAFDEGRLRRGMRCLTVVGSAGIAVGLGSFTF